MLGLKLIQVSKRGHRCHMFSKNVWCIFCNVLDLKNTTFSMCPWLLGSWLRFPLSLQHPDLRLDTTYPHCMECFYVVGPVPSQVVVLYSTLSATNWVNWSSEYLVVCVTWNTVAFRAYRRTSPICNLDRICSWVIHKTDISLTMSLFVYCNHPMLTHQHRICMVIWKYHIWIWI